MAFDRGALLAQTYQLPQQQQPVPQQAAGQPQPYQDEIGNPETGLQHVDGATSDYFDKWAALKGFARDVHENLGIDVRYPDPSVPESTRLHRIYLKSIADLKKQGELLKNSQSMLNASLSRGDIINVDQTKQPFATLSGNDVVNSRLDPIVSQANDKLQQLYFGNAVEEAKQYHTQIKGRLEELRDSHPDQSAYWQRQLDALTPPTKAVKQFAPPSDGQLGRINASGNFLKKVANMVSGTADGYKLSDTEFGPKGERVYVNKDMQGITYGGKPVSEWQHIPSTNETFLVAGGQKIPLNGADAVSVAKGIVTENPRFGAEGQYIDAYADKNNYFSNTGEVNPDVLVDPDQRKTVAANREKELNSLQEKQDGAAFTTLVDKLKSLKPSSDKGLLGWTDDRFDGTTQDGKPVKVAVRDEGDKHVYEIENIADIIGTIDNKGKKRDLTQFKKMSLSKISDFLAGLGVHFEFRSNKGETTTKPTNGTNSAVPSSQDDPLGILN